MFPIKSKKKQILAFLLIFLILLNLTGLIFKMRAAATPYIKWVSFTPTLEAIKKAIFEAKPNSVILITGKGNETVQYIKGKYVECLTDVQYAKKYFNSILDTI